jgi:flagellar biosynthesis protein FlhG
MTPRQTRPRLLTVAVTSGKGGVGKTNVVVNLAVALARLRHRVGILDADFGLGNVDVLLGLAPSRHLGHVLTGEHTVEEIMIPGPLGVRVIPASSGLREMTALSPEQWGRLRAALEQLDSLLDFLIIDTAAGISANVMASLEVAERVIIVTSLDPSAVVDAYAMVKLLSQTPRREIGVLVNNARDAAEAQLVFAQLDVAASRFLHRRLVSYGFIPYDQALREAVLVQRPVVDQYPQSAASRSFRVLASRLAGIASAGLPGLRLVPPPVAAAAAAGEEIHPCA